MINALTKGCGVLLLFLPMLTMAAQEKDQEQEYYTVSENRGAYVQNAKKEAVIRDKLLLLVVGANWCHDSRALARYFQESEVQPALHSYVLAKIDAGWLENLEPVLAPYGHPAYFGTPSLMIIEPNSNQLLNRNSMQRWQSAHSESAQALAEYLSDYATDASALTARYRDKTVPDSLRAFEAEQTGRLYSAYAVLGDLLKSEESGHSGASANLNQYWREVSEFRHQLQTDLSELHMQPTGSELNFPDYPPLSFSGK